MADPLRLLVIRLSSLGDVARLLPSLAALRDAPGVEVDLTVEDRFAALLNHYPFPRRVVPYPRRAAGSPLRAPGRWSSAMGAYVRELRAARYDLALDLHGILRSALVAHLSGAAQTAGYARGFGREGSHLLYGRALVPAPDPRVSRYERYAGALRAAGLPTPSGAFLPPGLSPAAREAGSALVSRLLPGARDHAVLFLGASRAQAHKRWPAAHFLALSDLLYERLGLPSVLAWGPDEAELVAALPPAPHRAVPPLLDLEATLALVSGARLFVGADTGFTHLAALAGVPTVAVLGPTDPVLNAPFGDRARVLWRPGVRRACGGESCSHGDCMGMLAPRQVLEVALELLEAP